MDPRRTAEWRDDAALDALAAVAERVRLELGVGAAAVSVWDRDEDSVYTIVNVGALGPGEQTRPTDEIYPVHSFPALVNLLEHGTPYCFAPGDPVDVSSASLAASLGRTSQASAPIAWRGEVWGSLWVSTVPGERTLAADDLPRVVQAAGEIARAIDAIAGADRARDSLRAMDELASDFRRDGACVVRGLLSAAEVERLSAAVEAHMADPSPLAIEGGGDASSGRFFEDFRNWDRFAGYEEVIRESRLGEVAAALMGSATVRLHHDHLLVKEPGTTIRTPWHQDQPYYNIDGADTVSFWIPLDPVPRESTLEFVAGSHSGTWYMPRSFFDERALVFDEGALDEVPDVEADRGAFDILGWPLEPGDAVAFNMLTLHAAAGSRNRRRAFSVRLIGDDVRLAVRPHATSPPFPELDGALAAGDALDHPLFPRLWPR